MHAPITPTGPQIGYAYVAEGGIEFVSRERLPALALAAIRATVRFENERRRATGLPAIESRHSTAQLRPHFDRGAPQPRVSCSSNAQPIGDIRSKVTGALNRLAAGYGPRAAG